MKSIVMVEARRQTTEAATAEMHYFVSSLPPDSKRLADAMRRHWEVENRLHWCLDVAFHEDACRTWRDHAQDRDELVAVEFLGEDVAEEAPAGLPGPRISRRLGVAA